MGEQFGRDRAAFAAQIIDGIGEVRRIPVDDSGNHQVQTGSPELLRVRTAVSDAPLLERADHLGECVSLLALVQAGVAELPELWRLQPVQHEQGPLDPTQLLQGEVKLILALECRQPLQHRGRHDRTSLQRCDQTQHFVPVLADDICPDAPPE